MLGGIQPGPASPRVSVNKVRPIQPEGVADAVRQPPAGTWAPAETSAMYMDKVTLSAQALAGPEFAENSSVDTDMVYTRDGILKNMFGF